MSEALNIVKASFGGLREVATSPLWQWDYGQILKITGLDLPQAFEVHFSNSRKSGETVTQIGTDSQVTIPDMYLTSGADIYCFIFLHDGLTDGETEYVIKIPVRERPEPSDIEPTPVQQDAITEAIAVLNDAVEQTGEDKAATAALAEAAAESARQAASSASDIEDLSVSAETLESGSQATVSKTKPDKYHLTFGIPKGNKGDTGDSGVYIGATEPTDPDVNVWIDTDDVNPFFKVVEKTKWLAIGDSITMGMHSEVSGDTTIEVLGKGWVQYLAESLNYDLKVMASRGMGYTATVTGRDPLDESAPRINLDTLLTRIEALTDDFNLITLAFGTNDYSSPSKSTAATIEAGLSDAIERLATKWKNANIIVITPFNKCSTNAGTKATKFDCGVARTQNNLSLHDVAAKIEEIALSYGVECINVTDHSCLNIINIDKALPDAERLLPDRTHPSVGCHKLIAKYMANKLLF